MYIIFPFKLKVRWRTYNPTNMSPRSADATSGFRWHDRATLAQARPSRPSAGCPTNSTQCRRAAARTATPSPQMGLNNYANFELI